MSPNDPPHTGLPPHYMEEGVWLLLWTEQENQGFSGGMKGSKEMGGCWQEGLLDSE